MSRTTAHAAQRATSQPRPSSQRATAALCAPVLRMLQITARQWGVPRELALACRSAR